MYSDIRCNMHSHVLHCTFVCHHYVHLIAQLIAWQQPRSMTGCMVAIENSNVMPTNAAFLSEDHCPRCNQTSPRLKACDGLHARADKGSNMHYTNAAFVSEDPDNDKPEALAKLLESVNAVGKKTEQRVMGLTGPEVDKVRVFSCG